MNALFLYRDASHERNTVAPFLFIAYTILYSLIFFLNSDVIFTDTFYTKTLSTQLSPEKISQLIVLRQKLEWVSYFVFPVFLFIKIAFPAFCIFVIGFLLDLKLTWKRLFRVALMSEAVFLIPAIIRSAYFLMYPPEAMEDVTSFAPFSLAQLAGPELPAYWLYAAQTINIFEIVYCLLLAKGIQLYSGKSILQSIGLVMKSYVIGLMLWVVFVIFLSIQFS
jgi:hypothetical protein